MSEGPDRGLWNRDFTLLLQGQLISALGSQVFAVAMAFWVKHETGSASLMGALMMLSLLPATLLAPIAGVVVDQYSRRKIIVVCDLLAGLAVLALAALMLWAPERRSLILALLFPGALLMGVVRAFFEPAISAALPDLVPPRKVEAANSAFQSAEQGALLLGQGLGGFLYVAWGAPVLFLVDAISYLISALSESFIEIPQKLVPREGDWKERLTEARADMMEGLRFVWGHPGLKSVVLASALLNFFVAPVLVLLPFYVEDTLGASPAWYGYILAAFGAGSFLGFGAAGLWRLEGKAKQRALLAALILPAVGLAATGLVSSPLIAAVLLAAIGAIDGFFNVHVLSLMQRATPSEIRGRVFGLLTALTAGLMPLGMGLGGVIADLAGQRIPLIYGACGLLLTVVSVALAFSRSFRDFLASGGDMGEPDSEI